MVVQILRFEKYLLSLGIGDVVLNKGLGSRGAAGQLTTHLQ